MNKLLKIMLLSMNKNQLSSLMSESGYQMNEEQIIDIFDTSEIDEQTIKIDFHYNDGLHTLHAFVLIENINGNFKLTF